MHHDIYLQKDARVIHEHDLSINYEDSALLPKDFRLAWNALLEMRKERNAPVDIMGCEFLGDRMAAPTIYRFQSLVAGVLSSQTKDETTYNTMEKLKSMNLSVEMINNIDLDTLTNILYGVSFHKTKAKHLKKISEILINDYNSDVPNSYESLIKLPGIGPKIAALILHVCYENRDNLVVDVHVHRICNRLGWVHSKTPEETNKQLQSFLPRPLYSLINLLLVGFGQQVCSALRPKCNSCLVLPYCPYGKKVNGNKGKKIMIEAEREEIDVGDKDGELEWHEYYGMKVKHSGKDGSATMRTRTLDREQFFKSQKEEMPVKKVKVEAYLGNNLALDEGKEELDLDQFSYNVKDENSP